MNAEDKMWVTHFAHAIRRHEHVVEAFFYMYCSLSNGMRLNHICHLTLAFRLVYNRLTAREDHLVLRSVAKYIRCSTVAIGHLVGIHLSFHLISTTIQGLVIHTALI